MNFPVVPHKNKRRQNNLHRNGHQYLPGMSLCPGEIFWKAYMNTPHFQNWRASSNQFYITDLRLLCLFVIRKAYNPLPSGMDYF